MASIICVLFFFISCNHRSTEKKEKIILPTRTEEKTQSVAINGKWIRQKDKGSTIIEIIDTANVSIYYFDNKSKSSDTLFARMGFFDDSTIWIHVPTARFDYRIKGDTLIEFDKMGIQGKFIKKK